MTDEELLDHLDGLHARGVLHTASASDLLSLLRLARWGLESCGQCEWKKEAEAARAADGSDVRNR